MCLEELWARVKCMGKYREELYRGNVYGGNAWKKCFERNVWGNVGYGEMYVGSIWRKCIEEMHGEMYGGNVLGKCMEDM